MALLDELWHVQACEVTGELASRVIGLSTIDITGNLDNFDGIVDPSQEDPMPPWIQSLHTRIRAALDESYGSGFPERERNLIESGVELAVLALHAVVARQTSG